MAGQGVDMLAAQMEVELTKAAAAVEQVKAVSLPAESHQSRGSHCTWWLVALLDQRHCHRTGSIM